MGKNNSFTLIEFIVVIGIIAIFTGTFLAYYNNFTEQSELRTEARKLVDVLELAKKKASSGDEPAACAGGFNGYKVNFNSNSSYILQSCCGNTCSNVNTYQLSSNITIYSSVPNCIKFRHLSAGTDTTATGCSAYSPVRVKNSQLGTTNNCFNITIDNAGIISLNETYLTCP